VGGDVPVDSETLLVTDFVNIKIKPTQSFGGAHRGRVCMRVHSSGCSYVYEYLRLYCVSQKKSCVKFMTIFSTTPRVRCMKFRATCIETLIIFLHIYRDWCMNFYYCRIVIYLSDV
jgi:hypothetical protein